MASFYENQRANAAKLIRKRGRLISIRERIVTGPSYNPLIVFDETEVYAVVGDAVQNEIDGTKVQVGDKRFTFVADIEVTTEMDIIDGDDVYSIGKTLDVKPGDISIVQKAWGRK